VKSGNRKQASSKKKTTATKTEITTMNLPVDSNRDHIQGPEAASITLVEYGDYECPYCGQAYPIIKKIQESLGDQLRFVFRNFPLTQFHPHAQNAAEASEAAGAQGKFWEMHDYLYEHQQALDDRQLEQHASKLGLDVSRFRREVPGHVHADKVREDFLSGVYSGVNGTPTFYINGVRYDDSWDFKTLLATLKRMLKD
jgi:protein-disulfide isomerase